MRASLHLDRIAIHGHEVAPRSATLWIAGDPAAGAAWRVTMSCTRLPEQLGGGPTPVEFRGWAPSGRIVEGTVRIEHRADDAYGTTLTLVGLSPLTS